VRVRLDERSENIYIYIYIHTLCIVIGLRLDQLGIGNINRGRPYKSSISVNRAISRGGIFYKTVSVNGFYDVLSYNHLIS